MKHRLLVSSRRHARRIARRSHESAQAAYGQAPCHSPHAMVAVAAVKLALSFAGLFAFLKVLGA